MVFQTLLHVVEPLLPVDVDGIPTTLEKFNSVIDTLQRVSGSSGFCLRFCTHCGAFKYLQARLVMCVSSCNKSRPSDWIVMKFDIRRKKVFPVHTMKAYRRE